MAKRAAFLFSLLQSRVSSLVASSLLWRAGFKTGGNSFLVKGQLLRGNDYLWSQVKFGCTAGHIWSE